MAARQFDDLFDPDDDRRHVAATLKGRGFKGTDSVEAVIIPEPSECDAFRRFVQALRDRRFSDAQRHQRELRRLGYSVLQLRGGDR